MTLAFHKTRFIWFFAVLVACLPTILSVGLPNPITLDQMPITVREHVVRTGGSLTFAVRRCNRAYADITYTSQAQLVRDDGLRVLLVPGEQTVPPGCQSYDVAARIIPEGTPPGTYYIAGVITVPTAFRVYTLGFTTTSFRVSD